MSRRNKFCTFLVAVSLVFITATNSSAYVSGDVDNDGVVRLADALLVLRYIAGIQSLSFTEQYDCDVFGGGGPLPSRDGFCEINDCVLILNKAYAQIDF
jgi:hypothetical protein